MSPTVSNYFKIPNNYTGHVEFTNGSQGWFKDGLYHREDGPAVIYADGKQSWWLDGINYSEEDYYRALYKRGIITKEELFIELL